MSCHNLDHKIKNLSPPQSFFSFEVKIGMETTKRGTKTILRDRGPRF